MRSRRVALVVFPGVLSLDVTGPYEVLAGANTALGRTAYDITTAGADTGPVAADGGLRLVAEHRLDQLDGVDLLIVPGGWGARALGPGDVVVTEVARLAATAERTMSVCTGAFVLAAAGLLAGRGAATHWAHAGELADRHPEVAVDPEALWHREGRTWTSAGVTTGLDLALHLVELDHGPDIARLVARHLVVPLRRTGAQSQFASPSFRHDPATTEAVRTVQRHIHAAPADDLGIAALAALAHMSPRHFQRRFAEEVGVPPGRYVEQARVEAAQHLLETEAASLHHVADRCGFGTTETLRRAFHRCLGISPTDYRARFGPTTTTTTGATT
ncbi:MAG: helix-turn-helix domain-containing protein [Actinomycetota bacterium]